MVPRPTPACSPVQKTLRFLSFFCTCTVTVLRTAFAFLLLLRFILYPIRFYCRDLNLKATYTNSTRFNPGAKTFPIPVVFLYCNGFSYCFGFSDAVAFHVFSVKLVLQMLQVTDLRNSLRTADEFDDKNKSCPHERQAYHSCET